MSGRVTGAVRHRVDRLREERARRRAHRLAGVSRLGSFGEGSLITPNATILNPGRIHIGSGTRINYGAFLAPVTDHLGTTYEPEIHIGDRNYIGRDLHISCVGEVRIGSDCMLGDRILLTDTYHEYRDPDTPIQDQPLAPSRPVVIEDGVFMGHGCAVLRGVTVGRNAYIAFGAIVTHDVPANAVVTAPPARVMRVWNGEEWTEPEPTADADWLGRP